MAKGKKKPEPVPTKERDADVLGLMGPVDDGLGGIGDDVLGAVTYAKDSSGKSEPAEVKDLDEAKPEGEYASVDTDSFLQAAKLFYARDSGSSGGDILSRSALLTLGDTQGSIEATDGVVGIKACFGVNGVTKGFLGGERASVVDLETLYRVAQHKGAVVYLVSDGKDLYVQFLGGRIYVPTYGIKREIITYKVWEDDPPQMFHGDQLVEALQGVDAYLSGGKNTAIYAELRADGIYTANQFSVLRVAADNLPLVRLRKIDLGLLVEASKCDQEVCLRQNKPTVEGKVSDKLELSAGRESKILITVPLVSMRFSENYIKLVSGVPNDLWLLDFHKLWTALLVMGKVYQGEGSVSLKTANGIFTLESLTIGGKKSSVVIDGAVPGRDSFTFSANITNILSVLGVFKSSSQVQIGSKAGVLYVQDGKRTLCILGKGK